MCIVLWKEKDIAPERSAGDMYLERNIACCNFWMQNWQVLKLIVTFFKQKQTEDEDDKQIQTLQEMQMLPFIVRLMVEWGFILFCMQIAGWPGWFVI